ncbi:MAG TPA: phage holin family protein [Caulobacteraceae bacterium]|nr:phage holin family protein [Caulobacteraceae bacterium]
MGKFIAKIVIAAIGLWLAAWLIDGIDYGQWTTLLLAGLLLGLVNAFVRPVVTLLTLPLTLVTLGLFLLVINAAMIGLVGLLLRDFTVAGLWPALLAAVVTGVVSWVGQALLREG